MVSLEKAVFDHRHIRWRGVMVGIVKRTVGILKCVFLKAHLLCLSVHLIHKTVARPGYNPSFISTLILRMMARDHVVLIIADGSSSAMQQLFQVWNFSNLKMGYAALVADGSLTSSPTFISLGLNFT